MNEEIEAKFAVRGLPPVRKRLLRAGARLKSSRVLERNWRFDDQDGGLSERREVLRVRQDAGAQLTFKHAGDDPLQRTELNVAVEDADRARQFLEALGYRQIALYEKYREVFVLNEAQVMLDELPFGAFVEIEGPDRKAIRAAAEQLGLRWNRRVGASYLELFGRLKRQRDLAIDQATFGAIRGLGELRLEDLGLSDALRAQASSA